MKKLFLAIALTTAAAFPAMAEMKHDHGSMAKMEDMKGAVPDSRAKQSGAVESALSPVLEADGFDLSFNIMTHKDYQKMMKEMKMDFMKPTAGTTHHISVSIRKDSRKVEDAAINMKVVSPEGKEETHLFSFNPDMMNQYVGHFNMSKKGKYQLLITFNAGKEKHQGGVYYEIK